MQVESKKIAELFSLAQKSNFKYKDKEENNDKIIWNEAATQSLVHT